MCDPEAIVNISNERVAELKRKVEVDWAGDETAEAWRKYYQVMKEQLVPVTEALVDAAEVSPGMTVLDLASGTGEPALTIARRISPVGKVIATDISAPMLSVLRENAVAENVHNVETEIADATQLQFADASFDRVTSRFGAMFFIEIEKALAEILRVLKPGGRAAFLVWGKSTPDTFFGATVVPYMKRMDGPPDLDAPTPMRYSESGKLRREVEAAGFESITETILSLPAPLRLNPDQVHTFMMEIAAPFRNAVASLPESVRAEVEDEVLAGLRLRYDGTYTQTNAPIIIVTGNKKG